MDQPFVTIQKSPLLPMEQFKQPYLFLGALDYIKANQDYVFSVVRKQTDPANVQLMSLARFQTKLNNVNPAVSLPVMVSSMLRDATSISLRAEEAYHYTTGELEFVPNEPRGDTISYFTGFEGSIVRYGTTNAILNQNCTTLGSAVTATFPIDTTQDIQTQGVGGVLPNAVVDAKLGTVSITDPQPDGTAILLSYSTTRHTVIFVARKRTLAPEAVLVSTALVNYLDANV
jgi:hypothetical protein